MSQMDLLWLASIVSIAVAGWVLVRFVRVSKVGIAAWCLGGAMMTTLFCLPSPDDFFGFTLLLGLAALLLIVFVSNIAFLLAAAANRTTRARNCACCVLTVFSLIIWMAVNRTAHRQHDYHEAVAQTTHTLITVHELGNDVESIKARLGRLPKDEKELVRLRGKPMPTYREKYTIGYVRRDDDRYYLTYNASDFWGRNGDLWGWIVEYYGPNSVRRLNVILF